MIIALKDVSKTFKGQVLFDEANAEFDQGKIHGITGSNGSGKSVLFKMICGFVRPDRGEVQIDEQYQKKGTQFPENFGIVIDRPGYLGGETGLENLKRLAEIRGKITEDQVREAMKLTGLDPNLKQKVNQYSLGMKQKLALAQAIMEDQEVLLLDEPFNALDSESVHQIRALLLEFKKQGKTIFLTSHNQEDIDLLCDHVLKIEKSKLIKVKPLHLEGNIEK
ncbi:ABC transporter ATP-binding protein [Saccharibacillus sp. JS10]|uniref:ABC transporter ATP-binding protein n=1 Tax=Saccharibacillus sp. JS10 TaxID=2950552 RepID=UPI00210B113F|nr:ABC transporter ATP-binding protein [Saccharibacillus sp. JS10]MCQ4087900.1 ABC transporter ATP-binding protein [Saccharibacillus sp. JS10]